MSAPRVVVAAPSRAAADAGARVASEGGGAADAAVAAMLVSLVTEPGIVSLAGGAFCTVAPADGSPALTVDGYVEMPGRGLPPEGFGHGLRHLVTEYGGHTEMTVGHGSVATPGVLPALEETHRRWGRLPWRVVVEPARAVAREGFPLGTASAYYLGYVRDSLFGVDPATRAAIHRPDGAPVLEGERMTIPDLADFLDRVAAEGSAALYRGDVARALADDMAEHGGVLTLADLEAYVPVVRPATAVEVGDWTFATNPPPAIGGPVLAALLHLLHGRPRGRWTGDDVVALVEALRAVLAYRATHLDLAADRTDAAQALLDGVAAGGQAWLGVAPSTAHVSVVDTDGTACAVTASSGYGSGITVPGTGVWLNNCLGEHELNPGGVHSLPPGTRLASNMAPTVGRDRHGRVLAVGSPGADRITSALAQVVASFTGGYDLQEAVDRPRLHVRRFADGTELLDHEEDLDLSGVALPADLPRRAHHSRSMYFGGVAAALSAPGGHLEAAADPRRSGAVTLG